MENICVDLNQNLLNLLCYAHIIEKIHKNHDKINRVLKNGVKNIWTNSPTENFSTNALEITLVID